MKKKLSSYQKLKQQIERMREYQLKMLDSVEFYIAESLTYKIKKDINNAVMFGDFDDSQTGIVKYSDDDIHSNQ